MTGLFPFGQMQLQAVSVFFFCGFAVCWVFMWAMRQSRLVPWLRQDKLSGKLAFEKLINGLQDTAMLMMDAQGTIMTWNSTAERLGHFDAASVGDLPFAILFSEQDQAAGLPEHILEKAEKDGIFHKKYWRQCRDGKPFFADFTVEPLYEDDGTLYGYAVMVRDKSREIEAENRLNALTSNLDIALENMQQGLCLYDADERLVLFNRRAAEIFRFNSDALKIGMSYDEVLALVRTTISDSADARSAKITADARHKEFMENPQGGSMFLHYPDGPIFCISERPLPTGGWVSTFDDVTELYRSQQRIQHMASHDTLTGLPNREKFSEHAAQLMSEVSPDRECVALASIDVDKFRTINDRFGYKVADALLCELARLITDTLAGRGFAARLGGDDFAVLCRLSSAEEADTLGRMLSKALVTTLNVHGVVIANSVSIGLALYPQDGTSLEELNANALLAMNRIEPGSDRYCRYNSAMDEDERQRSQLELDLEDAIANDQLSLVYQVQCSVSTGDVLGYEALLRWTHPIFGPISPERFIPIAESTGMIVPIGEWVIRRACRDAAGWREPHKVAVNISPVQLMQNDLPQTVIEALLQAGLPATRLEIEITESGIISDKLRALHNLRMIKAHGVSVAMDDFGTGYASLDTLHSFEFDKIKIDRSFLKDSTHKPQARAIIRAVLALGKSLGLPVLAEGVETHEQLQLLREEDCAEAQGFLLGRPGQVLENEALARSEDERLPI